MFIKFKNHYHYFKISFDHSKFQGLLSKSIASSFSWRYKIAMIRIGFSQNQMLLAKANLTLITLILQLKLEAIQKHY